MKSAVNFMTRIRVRGIVTFLALAAALCGNGCRVVEKTAQLPVNAVATVVPGMRTTQVDPAALQTEILRYSDSFSSRTSAAVDEYARRANTPEARTQALNWKLSLDTSTLNIATGPNPAANLIDFVAFATLMRASLQEKAPSATPAGALDSWLEASIVLETNAWKLAEATFTTNALSELRVAIERWRTNNPTVGASFFSHPQELALVIHDAEQKEQKPGSVFGLVGLDPMSGLDPAIREVTRTRLFAERAMFTFQRMPPLMRWQVELLSEHVLRQDQVNSALQSIDRLSRSAESMSQTAAALPDRITAERKAILDALAAQEGRLGTLSADLTRTLDAGDKMSASLNTTLITFNALMKRFGVGEPPTGPPDTNSKPFDITEYGQTADRVAAMAAQMNAVLKEANSSIDSPALDKRIADLDAVADRARGGAKSVLNHAFFLAAGLIVVCFGCALAYRRLAPVRISK
jgi:hypothetical protein